MVYHCVEEQFDGLTQRSIESPTTKLDGESDGEFGELEEMSETEFVGDVDTAKRSDVNKTTTVGKVEVTHSLAEWIWWFALENSLSIVKVAGYPAFSHEAWSLQA